MWRNFGIHQNIIKTIWFDVLNSSILPLQASISYSYARPDDRLHVYTIFVHLHIFVSPDYRYYCTSISLDSRYLLAKMVSRSLGSSECSLQSSVSSSGGSISRPVSPRIFLSQRGNSAVVIEVPYDFRGRQLIRQRSGLYVVMVTLWSGKVWHTDLLTSWWCSFVIDIVWSYCWLSHFDWPKLCVTPCQTSGNH